MRVKYTTWRFRGHSSWQINAWYYLGSIPVWLVQDPGRDESYCSEADAVKEIERLIKLREDEPFIVKGKSIEQGQ